MSSASGTDWEGGAVRVGADVSGLGIRAYNQLLARSEYTFLFVLHLALFLAASLAGRLSALMT